MIYFDNAATTAVCPAADHRALEMMTEYYGNPSSLHSLGIRAEQKLAVARKQVAKLLGCSPDSLVFTSGGTEANNLSVLGSVGARRRAGRHVAHGMEHSSVSPASMLSGAYEVVR